MMMKGKFFCLLMLLTAFNSYAQEKNVPTPQWRPAYHFTPPTNWTNDPNGLFVLNGVFQLYYQHNPFENKWGHMSWGHAESTDLVHWKNMPVAIHEVVSKDTTTWIYSGSAVIDKNNTSGFGKNGKPPIIAIFTGDQPKQHKESQFIAYSNDNGVSYKLYDKDPVIDLNKKDFRDPNVFWFAPTKQWIMTVSMVDDHLVRFYGSKDLKNWNRLSDFGPAGSTRNGWECPSLIPLPVNGDSKNIKYVLFVSLFGDHGPAMQYFIGDFDGKTFTNLNSADKTFRVDDGDCFYAAIAWRDAPQNKKILLGWLINGKQETYPWKGQMSIPRDLSIRTTPEGLRLFQSPTTIVSSTLTALSKGRVLIKTDVDISDKTIALSTASRFTSNSIWINAEFAVKHSKKIGFYLTEEKGTSKKIIVGYDAVAQELFIDCTGSESANKSAENVVQRVPMKAVNGIIKLSILLDRSSLEAFGNDGEKVISTMIYPGTNATGISTFSEGKSILKSLKMYDLDK